MDEVRADHITCYGNKKINTENIDSIAKGGFKCETCSSYLVQKNKRYSVVPVAVLAGVNGAVMSFLVSNNYFGILGLFFLIYIFELWFISSTFIKLEVSEPPQYIEPSEPFPFKIN